ncbi:MAG: hypothetical protein ACAH24_14865 [Hyphomicrobiaceae bacterium]
MADARKEAARARSEVAKGGDPEAPKSFEELLRYGWPSKERPAPRQLFGTRRDFGLRVVDQVTE